MGINGWKPYERHILYSGLAIILILAIICLSVLCPRIISEKNLGFDYMGVIVGILGLLVTVLIGLNVASIIDFNGRVKSANNKFHSAIKKANNDFSTKIETFKNESISIHDQSHRSLSEIYIAISNAYDSLFNNEKLSNNEKFCRILSFRLRALNEFLILKDDNQVQYIIEDLNNNKANYANLILSEDYHISIGNILKGIREQLGNNRILLWIDNLECVSDEKYKVNYFSVKQSDNKI
jgi:hypothetical protein